MEENQEEKKDEIVEIEEKTEGTNDGIKISNDVVAVIAGVAVSEVPGVASMSGGFAGGISEVKGEAVWDCKGCMPPILCPVNVN